MSEPKELSETQKSNPKQQSKKQKEDLQQSNPFKLQIKELSNQFRMSDDPKQESKKSNQNLQQSNPFKIQIKKISNEFRNSSDQNDGKKQQRKKSNQNLEQSNPFKMQIKQINNPFRMDFRNSKNNKEELYFGKKEGEKSQKLFGNIVQKQDSIQRQLLTVPKFHKGQSKLESSHAQQNIKKYKDTLRLFYNNRYYEKIKNLEQSYRKYKKENSNNSQTFSTQLKKPDICFKANRLPFARQNKMKSNSYKKLQQNYLISFQKSSQQFRIYQLKHPSLKSLKPIVIPISESQIGGSVEYDQTFGRVFYFSNAHQQIVVIGVKAKQVICRVKIKHQRINPLLYINKYKTSLYLLIVGGYKSFTDSIVEGSKYIQIFSIDKWEISLKQVILRLGIGRISPIIFQCDHENEPCIYIIGGYSNASLTHRKRLNFNIDEDINFSTNQTGVRIDSSYIEDCFLGDQQSNSLLSNNINVRFDNPLQLFGGCALFRKLPKLQKLELFLPKKKEIYTIKTLKNDVHIIESDIVMNMSLNPNEDGALNKSIGYHRDQLNNYELFRIDDSGNLNLLKVYFYEKKNKASLDSIQCALM